MNILFLDIDGVMVLGKVRGNGLHGHDPFDKRCVNALNQIIEKTGCDIVITSKWKHFFDQIQMEQIFTWNGVKKLPIGFTEDSPNEPNVPPNRQIEMDRGREILTWLKDHDGAGISSWCAVDDMDLGFVLDRFVRCTDLNHGLAYEGVPERVISFLNHIH
jgi:hypothetical protein